MSVVMVAAGADATKYPAACCGVVYWKDYMCLNLNIAICSSGELFGGVERHILDILSGLQAVRAVTLLILFYDNELAAQAREQGVETIILESHNRFLLTTSRQLAHILAQRKIRIVHVHGYKATLFSALARRWYSFAMVKTQHGLPEPMAGRPINALRNRVYYLLDCLATRASRAVVCYVTEDLRAHYRRAHSGLQVMVIPNGVNNLDRHRQSYPPELSNDQFKLVIVGRLDTVKGHHLIIEAIATENVPSDVHLYIVGIGPRESELRILTKTYGIANRVHFLGFRRNAHDYIAHCEVLLIPSLHEGLPYTLLEAMALGTPIIASRVGGLAEILQDGITALLIPPGDIKTLAHAIIRLYNDPDLRQKLSEKAQKIQKSCFSLEAMTTRYIELYLKLFSNWLVGSTTET